MKINCLIAVVLMHTAGAYAQDTLKYHLEDLFLLAADHNREVIVSNLEKTQRDLDLQTGKNERLPQFSLRGSADYATNMPIYDNGLGNAPSQHDVIHYLYNTGADFYLNLYHGNQTELEIKTQEIKQELAAVKVSETRSSVRLELCYAFLELYREYVFQRVIQEDIHEQQQQLKEIQDLYTSGVVLHSDVLRIELELSKREYLLVEIVHNIQRLSQKILLLTGSDSKAIVYPLMADLKPEVAEFDQNFKLAGETAFSLQKSELAERMTELEYQQQRARNLPQLSLVGSYTFANPQIFLYPYNGAWYTLGLIGLKLKVPVSGWYTNKPAIEKAKVEQLKEEEMHLHLQDQLKNQLLDADLSYREATIKRGICEKNIDLTKENLRIIKDNYFQSTALITDLLDANMNYLKSLFELETAKMNQLQYYYQIEFLKGAL